MYGPSRRVRAAFLATCSVAMVLAGASSEVDAQRSSQSYRLTAAALSGGGDAHATIGQGTPIGRVASSGYSVLSGFWGATGTSGPVCIGDCDNDGEVTIDEVLRGVNIALGNVGLDVCAAFDGSADGQVTVDELIGAIGKALNGCAAASGPQVSSVSPHSAPAVVPFSAVRVIGTNFGAADGLKRVTIGDREARVVEVLSTDTLLVVVPDVPPGPAPVVVFDGSIRGTAFTTTIAAPAPVGAPDTFDGTLGLLDTALVKFTALDLERVYGENAAVMREGVQRFRTDLAAQRAELAGIPPETGSRLDAIIDSAGVPELLRAVLADLDAVAGAGGQGGAATAGVTVVVAAQRLGQVTRMMGAAAAASGTALTLPELLAISTGLAVVAGVVGLGPRRCSRL